MNVQWERHTGGLTIKTITTRREEKNSTRIWYDCERREAVSEAVLTAASEHRGCPTTELPPLSAYADVDALNALFGTDQPSAPDLTSGTLEFEYEGLVVTVSTVGTIDVEDADRTDPERV